MTPKEIAEKSWSLWNDYYKDGDKGSEEILSELEADIEALRLHVVVGQSEQLIDFIQWRKQVSVDDLTDKEIVEFYLARKVK